MINIRNCLGPNISSMHNFSVMNGKVSLLVDPLGLSAVFGLWSIVGSCLFLLSLSSFGSMKGNPILCRFIWRSCCYPLGGLLILLSYFLFFSSLPFHPLVPQRFLLGKSRRLFRPPWSTESKNSGFRLMERCSLPRVWQPLMLFWISPLSILSPVASALLACVCSPFATLPILLLGGFITT
jgi:hypothetical protein